MADNASSGNEAMQNAFVGEVEMLKGILNQQEQMQKVIMSMME